jgi:hypothetical protein
MQDVEERVLLELKKLKEPVSGAPLLFLEASIDVRNLGEGVIHMVIISKNPYSASMVSLAEAAKSIALKCEGVKRVLVEVRNHVMADYINMRLNL